jgi:hypothetical protein
MRMRLALAILAVSALAPAAASAQRYTAPDGRLRVALSKQPFSQWTSAEPNTMANGGIQPMLARLNATVRRSLGGMPVAVAGPALHLPERTGSCE